MNLKGVKPRTHLIMDLLLFVLLMLVAFSTLLEHSLPQQAIHTRFMLHVIHGMTGIAMCITVGIHLLIHLPWIRSQLERWITNRG